MKHLARLPAIAAAFVLCVALSACASLGVPTPETFNEKAAAAYQSVTAARDSARVLLTGGLITADDAQNVQTQADNLRSAIDIARQIRATTPESADAKLAATITALNALIAYLESKQHE